MELDTVELEVVSHKFSAIADEMYFAIQRAARSAYVKEAADFATALLDLDGNVFAYPPSASFAFLVDCNFRTTLDAVPDVASGDVLITNDPYGSEGLATHLPDVNLLRPLFFQGKHIAWAWAFVHCSDVGGAVPSSMSPALTDIFQEGLRIPPMKLFRRGQVHEELMTLIRANSRVPDVTIADLRAMAGALALGETRLAHVLEKIGAPTFARNVRDVQDYAENIARDVLRKIPDGDYHFWDYMDDDLVSPIPVRIRVHMVVCDGRVTLDVSGTDPQVKTAYNMPSAGRRMHWLTFRLTSFITTMAPDILMNAGIYRNIGVVNPPGTVLHAEFPDAVNLRVAPSYRLFDSIGGALVEAVPDLMPAATGGTLVPFAFAEMLDDGRRKVEVIEPLKAGMGAMRGRDGVDARDNSLNNMRNHPLESVEAYSALRVIEYDVRPDSGGPGQWRGGVGQMMTVCAETDDGVIVARGMERLRFPPFGIFGGRPGATLEVILNRGRPNTRRLGKIHELHLAKGDTLTFLMPGGGGYGDPFARDAAAVLDDVLDGFVTAQAARDDYGVVIVDDVVDVQETAMLRRRPAHPGQTFAFGAFREQWDAVFDDALMCDLNYRLGLRRRSARALLRRKFFEHVIPELAAAPGTDIRPVLAQTALLRDRAAQAMAALLPLLDADHGDAARA